MKQFLIFATIGGVGLVINIAVTYVGVEYFGLWYLWSFCVSTFVTWTCIFVGNALFVFPEHERHSYLRKYLSFIAGYVVVFLINASLVFAFTSLLSINYLVSIVIVTIITTLLTFTYNKLVIFR